jgi:hypothetical protein
MSAKSIVKKNNSVLRKTQKVACLRIMFLGKDWNINV